MVELNSPRKNRLTALGQLQLEVLDILVELGEGTVYDVLGGFADDRTPRYTTVLTVLRSLEDRGLVTHRTEGRTFIFRTQPEARRVRSKVVGDVVNRVFGGSPTDLMSALLAVESVTPEVVAEIRALLDAHDSRTATDGGRDE